MADLLLFLDNYAIEHGLNLPGKVAGHRDDRSIILPAHHTMVLVHKTYQNSCITNKEHMPVSYNKFCEVWKAFRPYLVTANPRSDLCFTCQENVNLIIKSSNENIEKKSLSLFQVRSFCLENKEVWYLGCRSNACHHITPPQKFTIKNVNIGT